MKHSIKRQMTAVFMGLMLCFLIALLVLNARYLEPYYISNKETSFIHMYNVLKDAVENDRVEETEVSNELQHLAEKGNLSFLVIEEENERVVTNVRNMDILKNQLLGYLLNQAQKNGRILESTDDYQLMQSKDAWNETEYIEMWGTFEDGSRFLIRSPLESIKESAEISNRFFIYIGCAMVVISMILVWYF